MSVCGWMWVSVWVRPLRVNMYVCVCVCVWMSEKVCMRIYTHICVSMCERVREKDLSSSCSLLPYSLKFFSNKRCNWKVLHNSLFLLTLFHFSFSLSSLHHPHPLPLPLPLSLPLGHTFTFSLPLSLPCAHTSCFINRSIFLHKLSIFWDEIIEISEIFFVKISEKSWKHTTATLVPKQIHTYTQKKFNLFHTHTHIHIHIHTHTHTHIFT